MSKFGNSVHTLKEQNLNNEHKITFHFFIDATFQTWHPGADPDVEYG